jgi:O-antigen/teichoic acid export membrane protein
MYLILVKIVEVVARGGFIAGVTYSLGLDEAGQFGIAQTLIGVFALCFGWERHVDVQRRMVGDPEPLFDRAVMDALPFWGFNYLAMAPVFLALCWAMAKLDLPQLLMALTIVISEHVGNQAYQMSLVNRRYRPLVAIVAGKNAATLTIVAPYLLFAPSRLTLTYALGVSAALSALSILLIAAGWLRIQQAAAHDTPFTLADRIWPQHRASFTHFRIGIVAFLMLQYDRLAVGTFASLAESGIYFRHVLLVFFGYQLYTIASFNRITPAIFAAAKREPIARLVGRLRREYLSVAAVAGGGLAAAIGVDLALGGAISAKYHLGYALALILLAGTLIRVAADFAGLIVNARMREADLLRAQLVAFACGAILLAALTYFFGIVGAATASALTSGIYLFLVACALRAIPESEE